MPRLPRTLAVFTEWSADRYGPLPALRSGFSGRTGEGGRQEFSYTDLARTVRSLGRGLLGLGVRPGERVGILAETRPEWTFAQFAVLAAGAAVVPVHPSAAEAELLWVLGDSGAHGVIVENAAQAERVAAVRAKLPQLRWVALMDGTGAPEPALVLGELPDPGPEEELLARAQARTEDDLCGIFYTSGTTGPPKGCRLTHGNLLSNHRATAELLEGGPGDTVYLYLPLAHVLAQITQCTALFRGATLCYYGGRIDRVLTELSEIRPTQLPSVPRLYEKVHSRIRSLAEAEGPDGPARLAEAIRVGLAAQAARERGEELTGELRTRWEEAEHRLFAPVRELFGGRLRSARSGGAPIAPQTMELMRACGIPLLEGYGMTEAAGVITMNHPGAARPGTVGRAIPGCELRIAEDGEVLARGPGVFQGYHNNPAATAEVLDAGGWLHTGDLGRLDEDGYLTITGRKKELVITSSGKNITPSLVEFALQQSRWISHAVVAGDRRPYPVALLTLDTEEITGWARRMGVEFGAEGPARHPAVRQLCQEAVDAANDQFAGPVRIRAFAILPEDFTVADGSLTPTLKLRRTAITRRYAAEIDALYQASE
ncbi:AMP-dependent synthetase/ligase [Streptomyces orinoci]|uniref:AMP-dependent synthetase/ligase n=1 Tax=Streptomyces orinoci TaxID=67339 RepID=A0ABV3K3P9_STRON|nr:AMP-dependent synthetase/ligase [Streptomyces orinoci]